MTISRWNEFPPEFSIDLQKLPYPKVSHARVGSISLFLSDIDGLKSKG